MTPLLPRFVLLEPQFVLRRTLVTVARDLGVVDFQEASSVDRVRNLLSNAAYDGLVLDMHDAPRALALVSELRQGLFASPPDAQVLALVADLRADEARQLEALAIDPVLCKPFKIGDLLTAIGSARAVEVA